MRNNSGSPIAVITEVYNNSKQDEKEAPEWQSHIMPEP